MGKTRDFFKEIRDIKGTFHAMTGTMKDRKSMDQTEVADIKKRWQEYTEELYKKDLHDPDNHDGVVTYLEPDILECEVKWVLESNTVNKVSGGDGITVELFQILKDDAVNAALNFPVNLETLAMAKGIGQFSFHPRKAMPKNAQTTTQFHSSYLAK